MTYQNQQPSKRVRRWLLRQYKAGNRQFQAYLPTFEASATFGAYGSRIPSLLRGFLFFYIISTLGKLFIDGRRRRLR